MLQDQAMGYGQSTSRVGDLYAFKKDLSKDYPLSPLVTLDQERCIQCARCTRFCDEVAQDHVLGLMERGSKTLISSLSDPAFDTKFSGNTIDICPVGALTSRAFRFKSRVWELDNIPTVSMADGCGTNIFIGTRNEYLVRVIPRNNESINECWISDKDRFGLEYLDNDARLTYPLVRRGERLEPASWDEAMQLIADKLKSTPKEKIAAVGGPRLTNEAAIAMARTFHEIVGTPHVDCEWQSTLTTPGNPPENFYEELEGADTILVVGSNPNEELPILDLRLKKAAFQKKANLVVVNSSKTSLDAQAKSTLRVRPGTEAATLHAIAKHVHQSWHDEPEKTEMLRQLDAQSGARQWLDSLAQYSSGAVAQSAGVDEADLRAAADLISNSERLFLLVSTHASLEVLWALQNLAALKNRSDYVIVLHPEANAFGVRRAGLTPGEEGKSGAEILEAAAAGEIEVLYLAATNPFNSARDFHVAREALERVPFVVSQTLFLSEVTEYADVVLPAASFLEQSGTTTNFHGLVQNLKRVFRPRERRDEQGNTLAASAPDWMIFTKLAMLLGAQWKYLNAAEWTVQHQLVPPALPGEKQFVPASEQGNTLALPGGQLLLSTSPVLYDGGEMCALSPRLHLVVPEPYVKLHRADARKLDVENRALVEVRTSRGMALVRAKVGREVPQGTAWIPWRLRDVRASALLEGESTLATVTKIEDAPTENELEPVVMTA
jgi:NADH dehydrogenase/NADH:ubiquinone oxidoreductase subunit G